jgi:hypothetical protein
MSFKPVELFVFFILPFIAAGVLRRVYLEAPKWVCYLVFGGLGIFALWLVWESPNAAVRSGVVAMLAIVGIPTLLIALLWPWLVRFVLFPYRLTRKLLAPAGVKAEGVDHLDK